MKQIILPFNTGTPQLEQIPAPGIEDGQVLIQTTASVVSPGTERMLLNFGKAGWVGKMLQHPDRVKEVIQKIRSEGVISTIQAVRRKLEQPIPLGYSQAGIVLGLGKGVTGFQVGDRVASNGGHAEMVSVPKNLVCRVPDEVPDEQAAFTVLGAIALQGIRLAQPEYGECFVVIGLGLIGQLVAQLLKANGCRVIGTDLHQQRLDLTAAQGIETLQQASGDSIRSLTKGYGADGVIITASSDSPEIMQLAADCCRKRGRIILTGVVGLQLNRDLFFKKELRFMVSASYGPGRYDPEYELKGQDYPLAYVRWTENRNFEAVLQAMKAGQLNVQALITSRKPLEAFAEVYESLEDPAQLACVFSYSGKPDTVRNVRYATPISGTKNGAIAVIGAGNYSGSILLPGLKAAGANILHIISKSGLSASNLAKKYQIPEAGTDYQKVLDDQRVSGIVISTPHHLHASQCVAALAANKHVFVEKPLALNREELDQIREEIPGSSGTVTVGFNRRFAPLARKAKTILEGIGGPINILITINAGILPRDHWTKDPVIGGGRILGEACHFVDLSAFFANSLISGVCANELRLDDGLPAENVSILLRFANGSQASIQYLSNGNKAYDKERIELYGAGQTIIIENWKSLRHFGVKGIHTEKMGMDKGHKALLNQWSQCIQQGGELPIPTVEILNSSLATLAIPESIQQEAWIHI